MVVYECSSVDIVLVFFFVYDKIGFFFFVKSLKEFGFRFLGSGGIVKMIWEVGMEIE